MADAMNFKAAITAPPVAKPKGPGWKRPPSRNYGYMPTAPGRTGNKNEYGVLKELYDKNRKSYNSTKVGKKWKESYVKTGGGYVKSDYGEGNRGAAIPYSVGQRDQTRLSNRIAETESEAATRKAKEAAERAKKEAIKRRQKKKK